MKCIIYGLAVVVLVSGCTVSEGAIAAAIASLPTPLSVQSTGSQSPTEPPSAQVIEMGISVYREQYCGVCHTLEAAGTGGAFAPSHNNMGQLAEARIVDPAYDGSAATVEQYIRESILEPKAFVDEDYFLTRHAMPSFAHLDEEQIDALVVMLANQREERAGDP